MSGGVDTAAILTASSLLSISYACAITVCVGTTCPDLSFAKFLASKHSIPHHIVSVTAGRLVELYLPLCVKLLRTYDGMTLRNSFVICAAMERAREEGMDSCVVGDAADEVRRGRC